MAIGLIHRRPGELPAEVTGFVGRRAELAQLADLLSATRLVTATGPGGVGKTRVSLRAAAQAAERYADGVCLVELSALHDPELLPHTVATCLGLPERDARGQVDALLEYLRNRHILLILDTCEHLLDACAMLTDVLLRETPGVHVLATSRQPLDVPGEHTCLIPPLPVPGADGANGANGAGGAQSANGAATSPGDAVELFAQRAAAVATGFAITDANRDHVIRLCQRLDGIPLAIELATVRLRALPLEQLARRLDDRFELLTGGRRTALPRHQTLRTAIEWSYDLCTPAEQVLWGRLSVFAGTFELGAAEQVCAGGDLDGDDVIEALVALVDKSVVLRVEYAEGTRYRLLDTLREFGAERLAQAGEQDAVRERHLRRYLDKAGAFYARLTEDDQLARFRELHREHADIRAALVYALGASGRERDGAQLAKSLFGYFDIAGLQREGRHWQTKVLELFPAETSPERAWAYIMRGFLGTFPGECTQAVADLEAGLALASDMGIAEAVGRAELGLTIAFTFLGRHAEALATSEPAQRDLTVASDKTGLISLESQVALLHLLTGDVEQAIARCQSGLRLLGEGSAELWLQSWVLLVLAFALLLSGDADGSFDAAIRAVRMKAELGDVVGVAFCLEGAAWHAAMQQRHERTAWLLGAADTQWQFTGTRLSGDPALEMFHADAERSARDALGDERFAAAWRQGAQGPLDAVIAKAVANADVLGQGPAVPDGRGQAGPLTTREREIAELVSEGLSNREIAERLVISKRTVDAHVEHIFGKLGISSRVQLATWPRPGL